MADPNDPIPTLLTRLDAERLRALPLDPIDGFVLSRVDGSLGVTELAHVTGLAVEQVRGSLTKLASLNVVTLGGPAPPLAAAPARGASPAPPVPPPSPPSPVADVDLEPAHQAQIDELLRRAETSDHYALLGVPREADKKAIKRAYFELAAKVHPDKFFRKRLGGFKLKMETIFGRITEAHDTLTAKDRRAEYDAYLANVERAKSIEAMVAEAKTEIARAEEEARKSVPPSGTPSGPSTSSPPKLQVQMRIAPPRSTTPPARPSAGPPPAPPPPQPPRPAASEPLGVPSRREVLARRLTGNALPPPRPPAAKGSPAPSPAPSFTSPSEAAGVVKRHFEERVAHARLAQARKYADLGAAARAKNDMVAAANAYRVAASFAPDDDEVKLALAATTAAADAILSETYMKQAEYEERAEHWAEAARSWLRVTKARPSDAHAHERAAHCLVKSDGNLHDAAALAQRAAAIAPKDPRPLVTLANVYLAAGLTLNAKRELEAAAQLAPRNDTIRSLLKRLAKAT